MAAKNGRGATAYLATCFPEIIYGNSRPRANLEINARSAAKFGGRTTCGFPNGGPTAYAMITVKRIHEEHQRPPLLEPIELEEHELWGEPYRLIALENGDVRVLSAGQSRTAG